MKLGKDFLPGPVERVASAGDVGLFEAALASDLPQQCEPSWEKAERPEESTLPAGEQTGLASWSENIYIRSRVHAARVVRRKSSQIRDRCL
jgi:hypothetical protein